MRIGYFDFRETQFGIIRQITLIIISELLMSARKHRFETIHKQRQDNGPDDDLFTQTFSMDINSHIGETLPLSEKLLSR